MHSSHRPSTTAADSVRYLVTIDLERGRTLKVLRQMPDGSLHEVSRRPLPTTSTVAGRQGQGGFRVTPVSATLH